MISYDSQNIKLLRASNINCSLQLINVRITNIDCNTGARYTEYPLFFNFLFSGIINLFDERIVYSPDKDSVCSKRGTTEIL